MQGRTKFLDDEQIPGVPIMYITQHKYSIERLPEATIGGGMINLLSSLHLMLDMTHFYLRYMPCFCFASSKVLMRTAILLGTAVA